MLKRAAVNKNYDEKFVNYGINSNDNTGPKTGMLQFYLQFLLGKIAVGFNSKIDFTTLPTHLGPITYSCFV